MFPSYTHSQMIANRASKGLWSGVTDFPEFKSCGGRNCQHLCAVGGSEGVCAEEATHEAGREGMGKSSQGSGCGESLAEGVQRAGRTQNKAGKANVCQALLKRLLNSSVMVTTFEGDIFFYQVRLREVKLLAQGLLSGKWLC